MEFKPLEINTKTNWFKKRIKSPIIRKTILYVFIGAVAGFLFYYFSEGQYLNTFWNKEMLRNIGFGAFLGFFITNSPCARNKC